MVILKRKKGVGLSGTKTCGPIECLPVQRTGYLGQSRASSPPADIPDLLPFAKMKKIVEAVYLISKILGGDIAALPRLLCLILEY